MGQRVKIHLLRHAEAEEFVSSDAARGLTSQGLAQAARVGDFLLRIGQPLDLIVASPYLRTLQTAQTVANKLGNVPLLEDRRMVCGMSPSTGLGLIREHSASNNILLVGHQPDLSHLAASLLSRDRSLDVEFSTGSLLSLTLERAEAGAGILDSFIHVKQMG